MNEGMDRPSWHPSSSSQVPLDVSFFRPHHLVRSVLATWTGVLIVLVVASSRTIPPFLLAFLMPYLAMVAWSMLTTPGRARTSQDPSPEDSASMPRPEIDLEAVASTPVACFETDADSPEVPETSPEPRPSPTAPARSRKRPKLKAVPEPSLASWVQVGPGRFVRGEEPLPSPDPLTEVEPITQGADALLLQDQEDPVSTV
jgi:hypothetical protein